MRNIVKEKEPQKYQKVIVYNLNTNHEGRQFYLDVIDSNRMWIADGDPSVIIPVEDHNEWEDLSWLMNGIESKTISLPEKLIEEKYNETTEIAIQTF